MLDSASLTCRMGRHAQTTHWHELCFLFCFSLDSTTAYWWSCLLVLQHSPRCQGHKFSMQNLTQERTNVDTKSSIILSVCTMLCCMQCADCWRTSHGCRCSLTIISNSTGKDSIFYTRSTNLFRMGMKSMHRRASGNCLSSGWDAYVETSSLPTTVCWLALCQQRWNKAEILKSLLKDVAYSQQIPLDKMAEVI